ncbi:MAG: SPOR domain-containing protein, partial [Alphaproteobacteria bacterium]|nr:SPOR domain-containing protein [Alphaproteobacteria bacterium]
MAPNPEDRLGGTDGLEFEPVRMRPQSKRHWGRWVSFAAVVIISAGGGWYYFGDQLPLDRDNSVPIIRADITPIKIKPADPGGMDVPDRDKLVYDRLKGEGAGTNVERLLPPPETPIPIPESQLQGTPSEMDAALSAASSEPTADPPSEPMVPEIASAEQSVEQTVAAVEPATQPEGNAPVPLEPSAMTGSATEPIAPEAPPPPPAPVEPVEAAPVTPTPPEPALPSTQTAQATAQATQTAQAISQSPPVASTTTAQTKEYRIQLAALRTRERAETEWKRQKKAHPDILGALELFVVRVDLGGDQGVFFRLRAGPLKDAAAAKTLC